MLGRYGGEEFAVIAQGTNAQGGRCLAERIRQQVEQNPLEVKTRSTSAISLTLSVGVATVPPGTAADVDSVVSLADNNMYKAKQAGRNRVVCSEIEAPENED